MTVRSYRDTVGGRVAVYRTPNDVGDPDNVNAPCNAPLVDPRGNLQHILIHSDLDPMEVAIPPTSVTVNHPVIPAGSGTGGLASFSGVQVYGNHIVDHNLIMHGLPYVPDFFIITGSHAVHPGYPVQFDGGDGRARCVTAFADGSMIRLREFGVQTSSAMAAVSITYRVMVLRRPPGPVGNTLWDYNPETDILTIARGKLRSDRRYLQVVPGGSPFGLPLGRTIDLRNGTFRSVAPDGAIRQTVPASFRSAFGNGGPNYGPGGNYSGSFNGEPSVLVQAP